MTRDPEQIARLTPQQAYEFGWEDGWIDAMEDDHFIAVTTGMRGGRKGGPARARALSPERRSEIARIAARARWANR